MPTPPNLPLPIPRLHASLYLLRRQRKWGSLRGKVAGRTTVSSTSASEIANLVNGKRNKVLVIPAYVILLLGYLNIQYLTNFPFPEQEVGRVSIEPSSSRSLDMIWSRYRGRESLPVTR
jgi:hypothetical protein